jgi:hypothetical protein
MCALTPVPIRRDCQGRLELCTDGQMQCRVNYNCGFGFPKGWRGRILHLLMRHGLDTGPADFLSRLQRGSILCRRVCRLRLIETVANLVAPAARKINPCQTTPLLSRVMFERGTVCNRTAQYLERPLRAHRSSNGHVGRGSGHSDEGQSCRCGTQLP